MKHCPNCYAEYEDHAERCSDCGAPLAPGSARDPELMTPVASIDDMNDFVSVGTSDNMFEANTLKCVLVTEGVVNVMVVPHGGATQDTLSMMEPAWWDIRVSESDCVRARAIVEETKRDLASAPPHAAEDEQASIETQAPSGDK